MTEEIKASTAHTGLTRPAVAAVTPIPLKLCQCQVLFGLAVRGYADLVGVHRGAEPVAHDDFSASTGSREGGPGSGCQSPSDWGRG